MFTLSFRPSLSSGIPDKYTRILIAPTISERNTFPDAPELLTSCYYTKNIRIRIIANNDLNYRIIKLALHLLEDLPIRSHQEILHSFDTLLLLSAKTQHLLLLEEVLELFPVYALNISICEITKVFLRKRFCAIALSIFSHIH